MKRIKKAGDKQLTVQQRHTTEQVIPTRGGRQRIGRKVL